ncbi:MAG: methylated-DNA--[protein]-cysteine S-methyltransferase [Paludibacter sp.]|jgi:AraC family transcriptional regulator, regulatory protein of adaptative response / methylated-DNA-[protein]-cysteine methyltransferase
MRQLPPQSDPSFGFSDSPFGECCIAFSNDGICALTFPENHEGAYLDLENRFPETDFHQNDKGAERLANQIFKNGENPTLNPIGSDFQQSIWKALQRIPAGETTTYALIAETIGRPKAVRAVGTAIGANPIAYLIPCHRVIRTDGSLGGFRWGLDCKKKMLEWEKKQAK